MARKVLVKFTVEGNSTFPIDMLRYDACYPSGQDDVTRIIEVHRHYTCRVQLTHRVIPQETVSCPTKERWQSFGWKVVKVELA